MEEMAPFYAPGRECCSSTTFSPPKMVHFRKRCRTFEKYVNLAILAKIALFSAKSIFSQKSEIFMKMLNSHQQNVFWDARKRYIYKLHSAFPARGRSRGNLSPIFCSPGIPRAGKAEWCVYIYGFV